MQNISNLNQKTSNLVSEIKKDLTKLNKNQDINSQNVKKVKETVKKVHKEVHDLDKSSKSKTLSRKDSSSTNDEKIPKKLIKTKKGKSQSFAYWVFNNKEL